MRSALKCNWRAMLDAKQPASTSPAAPLLPGGPLRIYKRRWLVLAVFFMLALMNNLATYTYSPVAVAMEQYYSVGKTLINSLVLVFMLSGFTFRFLAMWMIDNIGLGVGVCIASLLNMIGCWLRVWPGTERSLGTPPPSLHLVVVIPHVLLLFAFRIYSATCINSCALHSCIYSSAPS